jgi:hypothetical protein
MLPCEHRLATPFTYWPAMWPSTVQLLQHEGLQLVFKVTEIAESTSSLVAASVETRPVLWPQGIARFC